MELTGFGEFEGVELLQKLHLFQKLTFDETNKLSQIMEYRDVPADTICIEQNALGDALWILVKGEVKISRDTNLDGQHDNAEEIGRLKDGELFGEMSLIDDLLTSARVTTTVPSRVIRMPRDKFEALMASDDKLAIKVFRSFCRTLSDRVRKTTALLQKNQAMSVTVR
ncbi:MAG: Crp/Fnr family transcriptional regulator [Myxococcaceae bacterium]